MPEYEDIATCHYSEHVMGLQYETSKTDEIQKINQILVEDGVEAANLFQKIYPISL